MKVRQVTKQQPANYSSSLNVSTKSFNEELVFMAPDLTYPTVLSVPWTIIFVQLFSNMNPCNPWRVFSLSHSAHFFPVELSSLIREVKAVRLSNTRAKIFWKQKPKIHYDVVCKKCEDLKCDQSCPETVRLDENKPSVPGENGGDITGLERGHDYLFTVVGRIKSVYENYWNETSKQLKLKGMKVRT